MDIENHLENRCLSGSGTSGNNTDGMCKHHPHCLFLDICDYLEVTPQQFFDSELHNLPLIDKATDLMKQLDDEDMLALISMLNRLALKRK